ncbi:MAG: hypothetical protein FWC79_06270 [Oscillospiraceae bacterium]|nr:hypothetical protein [Oscillospiraceae bacterium]
MSNAVYYVSYKLKKGADISEFLLAAEKLNNEFISKQKGYISWKQLVDGNTWADFATFETMEDLERFKEVSKKPSETAKAFYSFINLFSCKQHIFSVEKNYE